MTEKSKVYKAAFVMMKKIAVKQIISNSWTR